MDKNLILREQLALQRTQLANQTTLLSYIRTSLYFSVAGLSVKSVLHINSTYPIDYVFYLLSVIIIFIGIYTFILHSKKIKESRKHIGDYKIEFLKK